MGEPGDSAEEHTKETRDEIVDKTPKGETRDEQAAGEALDPGTEETLDDGDESWSNIDVGWDAALDPAAAEPPKIEEEDPPVPQDYGQAISKVVSEDISVDPDWQGEEAATVAVDKEDMAAVAVIADAMSAEMEESEPKPDDDEPITWQEDDVATVAVDKEVLDSMAADVKARVLQAAQDDAHIQDTKDTAPVLVAIDDEIADKQAEAEPDAPPDKKLTATSESQRGLMILLVVLGIAALVLVIILIIVATRS